MVRRLLCVSAGFAVATVLAQYLLPTAFVLPLAGGVLLGGILLYALLKGKARQRVILISVGASLALCYHCFYARQVQQNALSLVGRGQSLSLRVTDYAEDCGGDGWGENRKCRIRVCTEEAYRAYLYDSAEELHALEPGNRITLTATVSNAARINDNDIRSFTAKGMFLLLFSDGELHTEKGDAGSLRYLPQRLCRRVQESIAELYTGDDAGLIRALLTGDKSKLSTESYMALSEAGILHIAAVSGLHCMFLLSMVQLLTGKRRRLTAIAALLVLGTYALMVGTTPSVLRAVIMVAFLLLAPLCGRENDPPTAVGGALLTLLIINPFSIGSVSLQLSFSAVLGLICVTGPVYKYLTRRHHGRLWRFIASSFAASAGALVFTLPLTALYFRRVALVTPLSNLLTLFAASLTFSFGFLSVLFGALWLPIGRAFAVIAHWGARYILAVCRGLASLPLQSVAFRGYFMFAWLLFAYLLLCIALLRPRSGRKTVLALSSMALTLALCCILTARAGRAGKLNIYMLDVGQGECTLAVTEDAAVLIDCGSGNSYIDAGEKAMLYLRSLGIEKLDYIVLTHAHSDHTDGLTQLLSTVKAENLLLPRSRSEDDTMTEKIARLAEKKDIQLRYLDSEQRISLSDDVTLCLIPPQKGLKKADENENCLAALITAGDFDWLTTGDMSAAGERALAENYLLPDVEVLSVGHHGSGGSTADDYARYLSPEAAVISVGENHYGHPSEETVARLEDAGADIYRTDRDGTVRIQVR